MYIPAVIHLHSKIQSSTLLNVLSFKKKVSHETNRVRTLYSPWIALEIVDKIADLEFTLDLSNWILVAERMIDVKTLQPILDRTMHTHGRIGTSQAPQVSDPAHVSVEVYRKYFEHVWGYVWKQGCLTLTPEYGPVDDLYMPCVPKPNLERCGANQDDTACGDLAMTGARDSDMLIYSKSVRLKRVYETLMNKKNYH